MVSAFIFALVEALAQRSANRDVKPAARFQFVEKLLFHRLDLLAVGGNIDQVVPLVRIGLQVVETIS